MKPKFTLPEPPEPLKQRSAELTQKIRQTINRHGPLPFSRFMELALYTPGLGYYTSGLPKIGAEGDFITAPEVSPLFARCLARSASQILNELEQPNVIEFGAGKGTLAKDFLLALESAEQPLATYYIIELSADLKQKQAETLASLPQSLQQKVVWLDQLPQTPIPAVIIANEVLDAMPVEKLRLEAEQTLRGFVNYNEEKQSFEWDYHTISESDLQVTCNQILKQIGTPSPQGYETEVNSNIHPWLQSIADFLQQGALLLIDYGYTRQEYYQPARKMGTLRCHYQHRAHNDPFFYPGLQDITAHVDFTQVAEAGFDVGFKIAGFTTQAHFLMSSGILEMSSELSDQEDMISSLKMAQQIKTLTLPNEMGENFKVIALTKEVDLPLMGFQLRDLRHQL